MSKLEWGKPGSRLFETGIDRGVLYPSYGPGVPWIGLTGFEEDHGDSSSESVYFDGMKIRDVESIGDFSGVLSAFIYPDAFEEMRGYSPITTGITADDQAPKQFNLSYRTKIGNDLEGEDYGYRIHLIYNAVVVPSTRSRETIGEETNLTAFEWTISAIPPVTPNFRPTAHAILDSTRVSPTILAIIERVLYGDVDSDPRMLTMTEFVQLGLTGPFTIVDNGDGTITVDSPYEGAIEFLAGDQARFYDLNNVPIDDDTDDKFIVYTTS